MSQVCFVCGRKGSRQCLAGTRFESGSTDDAPKRWICSRCCGAGRRRSINCPETCPHFRSGARAALLKLAELGGDPDMELRHGDILHNLRLAVTLFRQSRLPDLKDSEVRQALANVADTLRTRASGLIFDFRSPDPRVQMLYDSLLAVATLHERGEKGMAEVDPSTLAQCLRYLQKQSATAEELQHGTAYFLDLIAQSVTGQYLTREPHGLIRGG